MPTVYHSSLYAYRALPELISCRQFFLTTQKVLPKPTKKTRISWRKKSFVFPGGHTVKDTTKAFKMMYNSSILMECCKSAVKLKISLNLNNDVVSMTNNFWPILLKKFSVCRYFDRMPRPYFTEKLFLSLIFQYFFLLETVVEFGEWCGVRSQGCGVPSHWCGV